MINLLPPEEKRILEAESKFKLIIIWGLIVIFSLVAFSLILLSIKFYVSSMVETQEERFTDSQGQNLLNEVGDINEELRLLGLFYQNQIIFSSAFLLVVNAIPKEININTLYFSIKIEEDGPILVGSLTGHSPNREALFSLKKNMEDEPSFWNIDFPPSNWVKPTDINFSITFNINAPRK